MLPLNGLLLSSGPVESGDAPCASMSALMWGALIVTSKGFAVVVISSKTYTRP